MTPLETEANPNIRVGPLRWGRPVGAELKLPAPAVLPDGATKVIVGIRPENNDDRENWP